MTVPVVICAYNRLDLTQRCLTTLHQHTDDFYPVIVNNASTDDTAEWLKGGPFTVTISQNLGWGRGANVGTAATTEPIVAQLNNDVIVTEDWLPPLLEAVSMEGVGMASSRLENPDGTLQHAGIRLFFDDHGTLTAANITEEQDAGEVDAASMACCVVRADCWLSVGGIDPGFYNGYEDVDFCLRARAAGWKIRYVPESSVIHEAHGSGEERWARVGENVKRLHERWADRLSV